MISLKHRFNFSILTKTFFLIIVYSLSVNLCEAQSILKRDINIDNEKLSFDVVYNWGIIWVHAAEVNISVAKTTYMNKPCYHLEAYGKTLQSYDWFFRVNDYIHTYVDVNTFQPVWSEKKTYEGGYKTYENYHFDFNEKKVYSLTETSKRPLKYDTLSITSLTLDLLTASFYARSIDYKMYKVNDVIPIQVVFDNQKYPLYIRYLGKETIELPNDKSKYNCLKFSSLVVPGTIFKGGESLTVWVKDDEKYTPIKIEAKIIVGAVKAYLKSN